MIILKTSRSIVEAILTKFFPVINLFKETRINNVAHLSVTDERYLSAVVINCILEEIELEVKKKLINTLGQKINFKFSDAQGVVLYKTLLKQPIPPDQVWLNVIRHEIIQVIDLQLTKKNLYRQVKTPSGSTDDFDLNDYD